MSLATPEQLLAQAPAATTVQPSPLAQLSNGRQAKDNNQILTTGIRSPLLPSNHALIITVSEYLRSPLPGVLTDRKLGVELAKRFGVPPQNIVELSEQQVTRQGLKQALAGMDQSIMPGDKLFVYFSGHGARYLNKATGQCTESLVMQDMHVVTNSEFAEMIKPLSAKTDKTIVMLDSCHSGGVAQASTRAMNSLIGQQRPKYSAEASSPQCSLATNLGSFSQERGIDLNTTDNNLVILAAAKKNEVAWDTSKGGALTYNFEQCLEGGATDTDHSGSISMQKLTDCVQARLDKSQEASALQHATLAGNGALVPAFVVVPDGAAAGTTASIDTLAALKDIYSQRDDRWGVQVDLSRPALKIGTNLALTMRSERNGYVYIFYRGTQPDSLYLLFPNQLDSDNAIAASESLSLPRPSWAVTALGPAGTDHLLVLISDTPRDFSSLALPAEYVSPAGPFGKVHPTAQAVARIGQIATLSAAASQADCQNADGKRDLGVARRCSNVFGASMVSVEETE
ncbi:MAG TPA: caspase family protein [Steroidobacteraceae bacterium]